MPTIFDNMENLLSESLKKTMDVSYKSDFCVGYFNLRGWKHLTDYVDCCSVGFALVVGLSCFFTCFGVQAVKRKLY